MSSTRSLHPAVARVSMKAAHVFALTLVLFGAGCQENYSPFSDHQIDVAQNAGSRVDTDMLMDRIAAICEARRTDPDRDSSYGDTCKAGQDCVYSRRATEKLIRAWWSETADATVELVHQTVKDGGFQTTNLWLDFRGQSHPDEWVIAVAHYDAWFCAANDNASGTAVLFEVARALHQLSLDRSVRILWVDGEELGMVGTGRYLEAHGDDHVTMVLNADMVAHVGDQSNTLTREDGSIEYWIQANEQSAEAAFQVANLAGRLAEPVGAKPVVYPGNGVSTGGVILGYSLSDHAPFWLREIPALFPFPTGDIPRWYHTPDDVPDVVNPARLRRVGRLWAAALAAFATVPE